MGLHQQVVFTCDQCDKHFTLGFDMELPPGWFGVQIAIADSDGYIPPHEREIYTHYCSLDCLAESVVDDDLKERFYLADKLDKDDEEEEN